jgi:hypothetical protein
MALRSFTSVKLLTWQKNCHGYSRSNSRRGPFVSTRHGYPVWLKAVVGGKNQHLRVESVGRAHALDDRVFKVVEKWNPRHAIRLCRNSDVGLKNVAWSASCSSGKAVELVGSRSTRRSFLPRGLYEACPQACGDSLTSTAKGRHPTTLNVKSRPRQAALRTPCSTPTSSRAMPRGNRR